MYSDWVEVNSMDGPIDNHKLALARDGGELVAGAVRFTGISRSSLYQMMADGRLPYCLVSGRRIIPRAALVRLLAENMTTGPSDSTRRPGHAD